MHGLITDVVFNNETGQPADNKWMSVFPCLQDLGLGQMFYGVLPFVEAYLNGEHAAADGPLPDDFAIDQDWATARKAYARRAARLIHSATAAPRLLFALGTLGPLMHGHASLFKRGTNQQPSGAKPSIGTEAPDIFDFADLDRSLLVSIFAQLCDYLMDAFHSASSDKFWRPVIRAASDDGRLPQDMLWLFRSVLCKVISGMYRRLLAICLKDPWVLTKMFDPRTPDDERRRLVDGLLQKRQCCLHKYLTLKLVRRHGISVETMLDAVLREFIVSFFNSCPLTTTLLECEFAQLNAILGSSKRPLSMHATNAKLLVDRLDSDYKLIRDNCDDLDKSRRPLWAQVGGAGRNGYHMYASATVTGTGKDFNDINASKPVFAKLGDDQKHFWRKQALDSNRHANILQKVALDSSVESFVAADTQSGEGVLGLSDKHHALGVQTLLRKGFKTERAFTKRRAATWDLRAGTASYASKDFTGTVRPEHCQCVYNICLTELSAVQREYLDFLHVILEDAVTELSKSSEHGQVFFKVRFEVDDGHPCEEAWQVSTFTKCHAGHPFAAELFQLFLVDGALESLPCSMSVRRAKLQGFRVAKAVLSEDWETDHLKLLDTRGKIIGLDVLKVGPTEGTVPAEVMVHDSVPFDCDEHRRCSAAKSAADAAAKLAASCSTPSKKRKSNAPSAAELSATKCRRQRVQHTCRTATLPPEDVAKVLKQVDVDVDGVLPDGDGSASSADEEWKGWLDSDARRSAANGGMRVAGFGGWIYSGGRRLGRILGRHSPEGDGRAQGGGALWVDVHCEHHGAACTKDIELALEFLFESVRSSKTSKVARVFV